METFRTRLIDAMRMRCVSAADLSRQSGLSKAQISQYVNGKVEARQNALHRLAVALNVSESKKKAPGSGGFAVSSIEFQRDQLSHHIGYRTAISQRGLSQTRHF